MLIGIIMFVILVNILSIIIELVVNKKLDKQAKLVEEALQEFEKLRKPKSALKRQNVLIHSEIESISSDTDSEELAEKERVKQEEEDKKKKELVLEEKKKKKELELVEEKRFIKMKLTNKVSTEDKKPTEKKLNKNEEMK